MIKTALDFKDTKPTRISLPPSGYYRNQIGGMVVGDQGYTAPWALIVTSEGACYLDPNFTLWPEPWGTAQMEILLRNDGFQATVPADWQYRSDTRRTEASLPVARVLRHGIVRFR